MHPSTTTIQSPAVSSATDNVDQNKIAVVDDNKKRRDGESWYQ